MKRTLIMLTLVLLATTATYAQKSRASKNVHTDTRAGNRAYKDKHYTDAETAYRKAVSADSTYSKAQYNLGNSLYRQKNYTAAAKHYGKALQDNNLTTKQRSQAFHNRGNSQLQDGLSKRDGQGGGMQQFQEAVKDYQEALKLDPKNQNTKYNLSYAKKLLAQSQQQQQQNGGGGGQQNQDNKKQQGQQQQQGQQDQQNQNDKQQGQQNQQNQQQGQEKEKQQHSQPQNDQQKKEAERLLNAVNNNEKNTMRKQQRQQESKVDARIEKDW